MKPIPTLVRHSVAVVLFAGLTWAGFAAQSSRVFVEFKPGQKAVAKGLLLRTGGQIHHEFDDLDAVAVTLPSAALNGLRNHPSVALIEDDPQRFLFTESVPYGVDLVQASALWDANHDGILDAGAVTGAGIKIGVIDSGVFTGHQDFAGVTITGEPAGWNSDGLGHGTHVSGTLAAALNGLGVVGVSPGGVSLHMVRVFGDTGNWIYASSLIAAANKCRDAGCKIISMSLGGAGPSRSEDRGFANLYSKNGILLVAAAGNGGNTATSYPAGYASVISVAAIDAAKVVASFSQKNQDVELAAPGVNVLSTVPYIDASSVTVGANTYQGLHLENSARGSVTGVLVDGGLATAINAAWAGKVVLVQRGTISFYDKVNNVQNSGGLGCVIYNNAVGNFSGTLAPNSSTIPAISISQADGQALLAVVGQSAALSSTFTSNVSGYAYYDGTSMATPHVAAVAALIWSGSPPNTTNVKVRTALTATAQDLGTASRDNSYGFGLIRAVNALNYLRTQ